MIDLSKGFDFEGYLNKNSEEQRKAVLNAYENTSLSQETVEAIKNITNPVNVVVYSEGFCPDCTVTLPFVKRMEESNSNIKVYYFGRKGNEELLQDLTGDARIPTVLAFTGDMEPKGAYVEVPKALLEQTAKLSGDKQKEIIKEYRQGKYNNLIEEELVNIMR